MIDSHEYFKQPLLWGEPALAVPVPACRQLCLGHPSRASDRHLRLMYVMQRCIQVLGTVRLEEDICFTQQRTVGTARGLRGLCPPSSSLSSAGSRRAKCPPRLWENPAQDSSPKRLGHPSQEAVCRTHCRDMKQPFWHASSAAVQMLARGNRRKRLGRPDNCRPGTPPELG